MAFHDRFHKVSWEIWVSISSTPPPPQVSAGLRHTTLLTSPALSLHAVATEVTADLILRAVLFRIKCVPCEANYFYNGATVMQKHRRKET